MDVPTTKIELSITRETHEKLIKLQRRTNSNLNNLADALLRDAIAARYLRFPNLLEGGEE